MIQMIENMTTTFPQGNLREALLPMINRTNECVRFLQEDVRDLLVEATISGNIPAAPEVHIGTIVPVRPPREIVLELVWGQSFSAQVAKAEMRPGGLNEEDMKGCLSMFAWLSNMECMY